MAVPIAGGSVVVVSAGRMLEISPGADKDGLSHICRPWLIQPPLSIRRSFSVMEGTLPPLDVIQEL